MEERSKLIRSLGRTVRVYPWSCADVQEADEEEHNKEDEEDRAMEVLVEGTTRDEIEKAAMNRQQLNDGEEDEEEDMDEGSESDEDDQVAQVVRERATTAGQREYWVIWKEHVLGQTPEEGWETEGMISNSRAFGEYLRRRGAAAPWNRDRYAEQHDLTAAWFARGDGEWQAEDRLRQELQSAARTLAAGGRWEVHAAESREAREGRWTEQADVATHDDWEWARTAMILGGVEPAATSSMRAVVNREKEKREDDGNGARP